MCHLAAIDWCLLFNFKLATAKKREGFPPRRRHLINCTQKWYRIRLGFDRVRLGFDRASTKGIAST
jgi:hypothetical protein